MPGPIPARIPRAMGRTAVAVGHIPDSGLMLRLTRGRAWIGLLSVLLAGIVGLNVISLSLGASQGKTAQQTQTLEQENSLLRARLAELLSNDRVQSAAATLGMAVPGPDEISYRDATPEALKLTTQRLASGFGLGDVVAEAPTTTVPAPTTTPPEVAAPVEPPATTTTATTTTAPVPTAPTAGTTGGGVSPG